MKTVVNGTIIGGLLTFLIFFFAILPVVVTSQLMTGADFSPAGTQSSLIGSLVFSSHTCRVMLEMTGHVTGSAFNEVMQSFIRSRKNMTSDRPLTPVGESESGATCCCCCCSSTGSNKVFVSTAICRHPEVSVQSLMASQLTWLSTDLRLDAICPGGGAVLGWYWFVFMKVLCEMMLFLT